LALNRQYWIDLGGLILSDTPGGKEELRQTLSHNAT